MVNPTQEISFQPRKLWEKHSLETHHVFHGTQQLPYQAIFYNGKFVRFAGKHYYVFPHEDLMEQVYPILAKFGKVEISETPRTNTELVFGNKQRVKIEGNLSKDGATVSCTQMRVNFVWDKFDPGDGKPVKFGGSLANSYDGSIAFSIMPYSMREFCTNGMMHSASAREIASSVITSLVKNPSDILNEQVERIQKESENLDVDFTNVRKLRIIHNKKMPVEVIASYLQGLKLSVQSLKARYREMNELILTANQATLIAERMPKRLIDTLDWLKVEQVRDKKTDKLLGHTGKLVGKSVLQYKAFNDITAELSHNTDRAFLANNNAYANLDRIIVRSRT